MSKSLYDRLVESYRNGTAMTVNVIELLNTLEGSGDVGEGPYWIEAMFAEKLSDTETMIWLLPSILHNGLRCPLNIVYEYEQFLMGNGHHRLVLALLCGIEEIPVRVSADIEFKYSEIPGEEQDTSINRYDDPDADIFYEILKDIIVFTGAQF